MVQGMMVPVLFGQMFSLCNKLFFNNIVKSISIVPIYQFVWNVSAGSMHEYVPNFKWEELIFSVVDREGVLEGIDR